MQVAKFVVLVFVLSGIRSSSQRRGGGGGRGFSGSRSSSSSRSFGRSSSSSSSRSYSSGRTAKSGTFSRGTALTRGTSYGSSPARTRFAAFAGGAAVGYIAGRSMNRRYYYNNGYNSPRVDYGEGICSAEIESHKLSLINATETTTTMNSSGCTVENGCVDAAQKLNNSTKTTIYWDCDDFEECDESNYECVEEERSSFWDSLFRQLLAICGIVLVVMGCRACCMKGYCGNKRKTGAVLEEGATAPPLASGYTITTITTMPGHSQGPSPLNPQTLPSTYPSQAPSVYPELPTNPEQQNQADLPPTYDEVIQNQRTAAAAGIGQERAPGDPNPPADRDLYAGKDDFRLPPVHNSRGVDGQKLPAPEFDEIPTNEVTPTRQP